MKVDFRYVEIDHELWALGYMLNIIEPAITRFSEDGEAQILARLKDDGWDDDEAERQFAWQDIADIQDHVLPRFMRGPFVVALWACFEASVRAVARVMEAEAQSETALDNIRRPNFPLRARSHFESAFGLVLDEDQERFERLRDLYTVRNGFAHTNGLHEGMGAHGWAQFEAALRRGGIESEPLAMAIVPTADYVEDAYRDVIGCIRSLVDRARSHEAHRH